MKRKFRKLTKHEITLLEKWIINITTIRNIENIYDNVMYLWRVVNDVVNQINKQQNLFIQQNSKLLNVQMYIDWERMLHKQLQYLLSKVPKEDAEIVVSTLKDIHTYRRNLDSINWDSFSNDNLKK